MEVLLTGSVRTQNASRYLTQLCKHWSHRFAATHTPRHGAVELPFGKTSFEASDGALQIAVSLAQPEDAAAANKVITEHLNRFAFREGPLSLAWSDARDDKRQPES